MRLQFGIPVLSNLKFIKVLSLASWSHTEYFLRCHIYHRIVRQLIYWRCHLFRICVQVEEFSALYLGDLEEGELQGAQGDCGLLEGEECSNSIHLKLSHKMILPWSTCGEMGLLLFAWLMDWELISELSTPAEFLVGAYSILLRFYCTQY